jgi:hypothetical protein
VRQYGGRAPWSLFFYIQKNQILNFEIFYKKYQSVVYDLFYLCVNLYYEIPCIMSSQKNHKILNLGKNSDLGICSNFWPICLFCWAYNTRYFTLKFCMPLSVHSLLHPHIFFYNFLRL